MERKEHWETIHKTKSPTEVSWFQAKPSKSLEFIRETGVGKDAAIIDIGGGASTLVDHLIQEGYGNITVLDISAKALETAKQRLGKRAEDIQWLRGDITQVNLPEDSYDIWHNRAVFHFLIQAEDRERYRLVLEKSLKSKGCLILATFSVDGPPRYSGLDVARYNAEGLQRELGDKFQLIKSLEDAHQTPFGTRQKFIYCHFQKT